MAPQAALCVEPLPEPWGACLAAQNRGRPGGLAKSCGEKGVSRWALRSQWSACPSGLEGEQRSAELRRPAREQLLRGQFGSLGVSLGGGHSWQWYRAGRPTQAVPVSALWRPGPGLGALTRAVGPRCSAQPPEATAQGSPRVGSSSLPGLCVQAEAGLQEVRVGVHALGSQGRPGPAPSFVLTEIPLSGPTVSTVHLPRPPH